MAVMFVKFFCLAAEAWVNLVCYNLVAVLMWVWVLLGGGVDDDDEVAFWSQEAAPGPG